jgi:hypothetical protein
MISRSSRKEKLMTAAICFSAVVLTLSAVLKLVSATRNAAILLQPDPIFQLTNRDMFVLVGLLEMAAIGILLSGKPQKLKLFLVAALSTNFLLYRLGLVWLGQTHSCPCFGNAADWLHLPPKKLELITKIALGSLLAVSYGALAMSREGNHREMSNTKDPTLAVAPKKLPSA